MISMPPSCPKEAPLLLTLYSDWHFCSACGLPPVDVDVDVDKTTVTTKKCPLATDGENVDANADGNYGLRAEIHREKQNQILRKTPTIVATQMKDPKQQQQQSQSKPKKTKKKLSTCRRCKTAAYHNAECQKSHWKRGHKHDCRLLADAIQPLLDIARCWNTGFHRSCSGGDGDGGSNNRRWWDIDRLDPKGAKECHRLWKTNEVRWNRRGEYLEAMDGFQRALEPIAKLWKDRTKTKTATNTVEGERDPNNDGNTGLLSLSALSIKDNDSSTTTTALGISLARRLLFCAYCEADGNQIQIARMRLAQCISILLECAYQQRNQNQQQKTQHQNERPAITPLLNDAWMELMLSYEEERSPELRKISRHVAHMAIQSSCGNTLYRCEWMDALQRPGYMATLKPITHVATADTTTTNDDGGNQDRSHAALAPPYIPPEDHPTWCRTLESHWKEIANELSSLMETKRKTTTAVSRRSSSSSSSNYSSSSNWTVVGSGDRGSGGDDHRVVSAGGKWTEHVLFGTGANTDADASAPFTKRLLRDCVPDAVSLAEAGGGEVIFSKLAPHTRIDAHCGPTNFRWTAHLGLVIPSPGNGDCQRQCQIRVADRWHNWAPGKVFLFDDSYEHEIRNDTDEVRIVLLLRFWHPGLDHHQRNSALREARRRKEASVEKRYHAPSIPTAV